MLSVVNAFSDRNHKAMDQVEACQLVYRGPVFLVLDPDAFGITMPHRRGSPATLQLYQDTVTYSRLPFSCMLPFRAYPVYLAYGNPLFQ